MDRFIKISTWPQAVVAASGLLATAGIVVALVMAGWSGEAIAGFAALVLGLATGQYVQTRKASVVEAKTDQQTEMLETVVRQTNGLGDQEREDIAERIAHKIMTRRGL